MINILKIREDFEPVARMKILDGMKILFVLLLMSIALLIKQNGNATSCSDINSGHDRFLNFSGYYQNTGLIQCNLAIITRTSSVIFEG
jgi:hypothetical protein